jgi:hypothetical protein
MNRPGCSPSVDGAGRDLVAGLLRLVVNEVRREAGRENVDARGVLEPSDD